MDSIFLLPLACLCLLQLLLALPLVLLQPLWRPGALYCAQFLCKSWTNNASKSVILTIVVALSGLLFSSLLELMRVHTHQDVSNLYETLVTIDTLRAQVSSALCLINLLLIFFSRGLATALTEESKMSRNLEAMRRQTKGLQAEYDRLTSASKDGKVADSEVGPLKAQVDKLIAQKAQLQADTESAKRAQYLAEATTEALKRQAGGLNKEYDRVCEENIKLQKILGRAGVPGFEPEIDKMGAKDE